MHGKGRGGGTLVWCVVSTCNVHLHIMHQYSLGLAIKTDLSAALIRMKNLTPSPQADDSPPSSKEEEEEDEEQQPVSFGRERTIWCNRYEVTRVYVHCTALSQYKV